jgi:hypothetical protein
MRLMLVEYINDDPYNHHRTELFPFLQAFVRRRGGVARWVSIPAGQGARPCHPFLVELPEAPLTELIAEARRFGPTHLVANEEIGPAMLREMERQLPGAVLLKGDGGVDESSWRAITGTENPVDQFGPGPHWLLGSEQPDYDVLPLGFAEGGTQVPVPIISRCHCTWLRSVENNPHFRGLDLSGLEHPLGCSFCCTSLGTVPENPLSAIDVLLKQLRRYNETIPDSARSHRFMVTSGHLFHGLDDFLRGLLGLSLPPSTFLLTCRVDEFLRGVGALDARLPEIAKAGHSLHLWQVGLENFSPEENLRFNKGLSTDQIVEMLKWTDNLEQRWPETFAFRRYGGFGTILFTPWTRIEDLRINVDSFRRHRLTGMLTTRLILRRGTPLERLAERDGLVGRASHLEGIPSWGTCITTFGEEELPWHFQSREVAEVYALMTVLFPREELTTRETRAFRESLVPRIPEHLREVGDQVDHLDALLCAAENQGTTASGLENRQGCDSPNPLFDAYLDVLGSRHDSPVSAPVPSHAEESEDCLLFHFAPPAGQSAPPCTLRVCRFREGRKHFRRVGQVVISHDGEHLNEAATFFSRILVLAAKRLPGALSSTRDIALWRHTVQGILTKAGLADRLVWRVEVSLP